MSNNKQAADEGWIEWKGGECPVDGDVLVEVELLSDDRDVFPAKIYDWKHVGADYDIARYRLHKPENNDLTQVCDTHAVELKPTIESLAADYRAKLAIYEQAQEELNAHLCGVEAALSRLELAGKALGLVIGIAGYDQAEPEPINITDWRDLRVGDVVEVIGSDNDGWKRLAGLELDVVQIGNHCDDVKFKPRLDSTWTMSDNTEWRFIRRP